MIRVFLFVLTAFLPVVASPYPLLKFHGTEETLERIKEIISHEEKGAYLRFGDGDVNLALGQNDLLQTARYKLMREMQEAFCLNGPTILKTLPLYCRELGGYEEGMFPGNHEAPYGWCLDMLEKVSPLWGDEVRDVYSHAALHFSFSHRRDLCLRFLRFLRTAPCFAFIGNERIPKHIRDLLFGSQCLFIPTRSKQSYDTIDAIEERCLQSIPNTDEYKVIITAMGCSGRALQKRLWNKLDHVFLFDFGSVMDALCGWNTRAWIEMAKVDERRFLSLLEQKVHLVCTAALIPQDYEARRQEYIRSFESFREQGFPEPHVLEAICAEGPTFLEEHSSSVSYPYVNDESLRNKGVNEARLLKAGLDQLSFNEEDMVIKVTGRYFFTSDTFIKAIEEHPTADAFVKLDPHGQVYTGCYAMRCKLFKEMLSGLNLEKMESEGINIEKEVANYLERIVKERGSKVLYLEHLGLTADIFGRGERMRLEL